jgi:uncharacterized membrane protein
VRNTGVQHARGQRSPSPITREAGLRLARQALVVLTLAFLAYQGLRFYFQDVLHFALDYSEPNFGRLWPNRFWLLLHVAGATAALFVGPFQLWSGLRRRHPSVHRWTGRLYLSCVVAGGAPAFYLSLFVKPRNFGIALFGLGAAWWLTVGMAFLAIKRHRIEAHKEWMIRGYVVTFAFVTFRWWIDWPMWSFLGPTRLATVSWLSWIVPLLVTEVLLRRRNTRMLGRV